METFAIVDIATIALAVATTVLAGFTGWLSWETRQIRAGDKHERGRLAFRAALFEQLDNCREWQTHPPDRGASMLEYLQGRAPRFEAVQGLLAAVDLPSDLAAYVVWLVAAIRDEHQRFEQRLNPIDGDDLFHPERFRDDWWVLVDRLQLLTCLLAEEARRRGMHAVLPGNSRWLRSLPCAPHGRVLIDANDRALRAAPAWPDGFDGCAPARRDEQGAALAREQQAQIVDTLRHALTS